MRINIDEERKPFNAKEVLNSRLKVAPFQKQMISGGTADFSGGYFTRAASPFSLFTVNMTVRQYLERLPKFLRGLSDVMCYRFLSSDEGVQYQLGLTTGEPETLTSFMSDFEKIKNKTDAALNPKIFIRYCEVDSITQNELLKQKTGFDFELAATKIENLFDALKNAETGQIKGFRRFIIKAGPNNLRSLEGLYPALMNFYSSRAVESEGQYSLPDVGKKMQDAMDQVTEILSTHIKAAIPQQLKTR